MFLFNNREINVNQLSFRYRIHEIVYIPQKSSSNAKANLTLNIKKLPVLQECSIYFQVVYSVQIVGHTTCKIELYN